MFERRAKVCAPVSLCEQCSKLSISSVLRNDRHMRADGSRQEVLYVN